MIILFVDGKEVHWNCREKE